MKSLKNLIIPAIVLVVLIVGAIVWFNLKPKEEVVEQETSISVLSIPTTNLNYINVDKKIGSSIRINVSTNSEGASTFELIDDNPDNDDANLSASTLSNYLSVLTSFVANSVISEPSALADYGLEEPEYTITYSLTDGSTKVLKIGNTTYDGSSCYFMVDGDPNVYTCLTIKRVYAAYTNINFLTSQLINISYDDIATVTFDRNTDNTHFTATCDVLDTGSPVYYCINPYKIKASAYFENLIEKVVNLEIAGYVDLSDEEVANYGLDNPAFTFTFVKHSGETVYLSLTESFDGTYYGKCSEVDEYFTVSTMQLSGLETPVLTLLSSYLNYYSASELSKIRGSYEGTSFEFSIDVDSAINDENGSVTLNGRNAYITNSQGRRSYAAILFESLVCVDIGGIDIDANPSYDSVLNITYVTKDYKIISVDFVQRDTDSYYVFVDGEYSCFYVYSRELFRNGGTDTFSYGAWAAYELCEQAIDGAINGTYDIPEEG